MAPEKRRNIARILSLLVIIAGILVIIGWIFDIGFLKSITNRWVSMKLITAMTFVLSGITLYFVIHSLEGNFDKAQVVLTITSMTIMLFMGVLFFSSLLGIHTGLEDLFIKELPGEAKTVVPGRPSVPTMLNFMLVALAGISTMRHSKSLITNLKIIGFIITIISTIAIIGYIFNFPLFYYYIEGKNSAIACHTAVLFLLLGTGLLCLSD